MLICRDIYLIHLVAFPFFTSFQFPFTGARARDDGAFNNKNPEKKYSLRNHRTLAQSRINVGLTIKESAAHIII